MKITRSIRQAGIAAFGRILLLVVTPAAAHVRLVHEPAGDSKITSGVVLAPLPPLPREVRRAVKPPLQKSFWVLTAGVYTAAGLDMQRSESMLPNFDERDPIVRPFLRLPAPAYYASAALFATGVNYLGWKMARSERWHKIWWVPQIASMAGSFAGYGYTRAHPQPH
jgi:hypothetical protein